MSKNTRVNAIYALPEASTRPSLAVILAKQTSYSSEEARKILTAAPVECMAAGAPGDDDGAGEVVSFAKSIGLKGFVVARPNVQS